MRLGPDKVRGVDLGREWGQERAIWDQHWSKIKNADQTIVKMDPPPKKVVLRSNFSSRDFNSRELCRDFFSAPWGFAF